VARGDRAEWWEHGGHRPRCVNGCPPFRWTSEGSVSVSPAMWREFKTSHSNCRPRVLGGWPSRARPTSLQTFGSRQGGRNLWPVLTTCVQLGGTVGEAPGGPPIEDRHKGLWFSSPSRGPRARATVREKANRAPGGMWRAGPAGWIDRRERDGAYRFPDGKDRPDAGVRSRDRGRRIRCPANRGQLAAVSIRRSGHLPGSSRDGLPEPGSHIDSVVASQRHRSR